MKLIFKVKSILKNDFKYVIFFLFFSAFFGLIEAYALYLVIPVVDIIQNLDTTIDDNQDYNLIIKFLIIIIFLSFLNLIFISSSNYFVNYIYAKLGFLFFQKSMISDKQEVLSKSINQQLNENSRFAHAFLLSFITIISKLIVLFVIIFSIISVEPALSLILIIFILFFYIIYFLFIKNFLKKSDLGRTREYENLTSYLITSFSIKEEIKVLRATDRILLKFKNSINLLQKFFFISKTFGQYPRYIFEIIIVSLILVILFNFQINFNLSVLGFYFYAFYRIIPSIQLLSLSYTQMYSNFYVVDNLFNFYSKINQHNKEENERKHIQKKYLSEELFVKNLDLSFNNSIGINKISFKIYNNKINIIDGSSGSGKTTIIKSLLNFNKFKSQGSIIYMGEAINDLNDLNIGYIPQKSKLFHGSILENISLFSKEVDIGKIRNLISLLNFDFINPYLNNDRPFNINELSGGETQKICLLRSLYFQPDFLILDESLSEIDELTSKKILDTLLGHLKITLLITSHNEEFKKYYDSNIILIN